MHNASFIVLEGIDGAGTTTHAALLVSALRHLDVPVHATREPSDGPLGVVLRQILTGQVVRPGPHRIPRWHTLGLLFGADRLDHLDAEVLPNLDQGVTVVCDRYDYSTIAYQSLSATGNVEPAQAVAWLREVNHFARRPDLTIVLDVPAEVAHVRRTKRGGANEIFDDELLQRALAGFYGSIEQHFPGDEIVHIAADRCVESVAAEILSVVLRARERG